MKHVTIGIPEGQYAFFMKLIRSLTFPVIIEQPEEKAILKNIETGLNQMKEVKAGKRKSRPVSELLREMADDKG